MRVLRSFFGSLLLVWLFKSSNFIYIFRQSAIFFFSFHFVSFQFFSCITSSSSSVSFTHCSKHWLYIHSYFKHSHTHAKTHTHIREEHKTQPKMNQITTRQKKKHFCFFCFFRSLFFVAAAAAASGDDGLCCTLSECV